MKPIHLALTLAAGLVLPQAVTADEAGHLLAQSCAGCHGQEGAGVGAAPAIAGIPPEDFIAMWSEFRADERPATIMNRIARGYTDDEIAALAAYFAALD